MSTNQKVLGPFVLAMISIAAIINLRGLPIMASVGLNSVFFYILAALLFLIPSSLICAELASTFPEAGGIYLWVKKAFGEKTGFFTIWLEWINNVISYPASLSFMSATLAYIFSPVLGQHKLFIFITTLILLWSVTLFSCLGIKASSRLNIFGALLGTLIPGAIIIFLGFYWILSHHHSQIVFSFANIFPDFSKLNNLAFFAGVLSGYSGMQLIAFHAPNVKHPRRDYPKAIFMAVILILLITLFASLAIAIVVPHNQLNLVSGLMEGFENFFSAFHVAWTTPILAFLILFGGISTLSAWLLGPARGMSAAAKNGLFPKLFAKENKGSSPVNVLIMQAVMASILSLVFLYLPNSDSAFWVLIDLSSQSTLLMYIFVFSAAIRLRYSEAQVTRPYKIPGGNVGLWIIAGAAIIACIVAIIISFVPPTGIQTGELWRYEGIIIGSNVIYLSVPFVISYFMKKRGDVVLK
jgi:amino acid transporter